MRVKYGRGLELRWNRQVESPTVFGSVRSYTGAPLVFFFGSKCLIDFICTNNEQLLSEYLVSV